MNISPARLVAFQVFSRVQKGGCNAAELLHSELTLTLGEQDLALSNELVYGVLRHQLLLDWVLSTHCTTGLLKLDSAVLLALRLGAYQLLFLDRVPARAAVHQSVELVKRAKLKSAAGLVNAVLRQTNRIDLSQVTVALGEESDQAAAVLYSHPQWLVARWRRKLSREKLIPLLMSNNQPPKTYFRMNTNQPEDVVLENLETAGIKVEPHPLVDGCWRVLKGNLLKTRAFRSGAIYLQDPASQLIPRLLQVKPAHRCLDLCTAPGGKLTEIARQTQGKISAVGVDSRWERLQVTVQLHRKQWPHLSFVAADGIMTLPFSVLFDRVLVDAPCSGTGTLQRNPDIRWRLSPADLDVFPVTQLALLKNGAKCLTPGGILVYSTCSLEEEENQSVVSRFLQEFPEYRLEIPADPRLGRFFSRDGYFQLLPSENNSDGFFAAVIRRQGQADQGERRLL